MARPRKDKNKKKAIRLFVRLTEGEQKRLQYLANKEGLTISDFARLALFASKPRLKKSDPERIALIQGLGQLGKIGSNLNMISREINRHRIVSNGARVPDSLVVDAEKCIQSLADHLLKILEGS